MKYPGIRPRSKTSWEIKYYVNGKPKTETVKTSSIEEANMVRSQRIVAERSNSNISLEQNNVTFEQAFKSYLEIKSDLDPSTIQRSVCIFNHFVDFVNLAHPNIRFIQQVTVELGRAYKLYLITKTTKTKSGINTEISKLRAIFKVFCEYMGLAENPFAKVEKFTRREAKPKEKHLPTDREVRTILDNNDAYIELTKYIMSVGRRIEETTLYKKRDVICDPEGKPLYLKIKADDTKTDTAEDFYFNNELSAIVAEALNKFPKSEYLFTNEWGRKVSQNTYRGHLQRLCKAHKIVYSSPHCFRYFVVNKLINGGVNLKDAMSVTGHINVESFLQYLKSTPEGRMKALEITNLSRLGVDDDPHT